MFELLEVTKRYGNQEALSHVTLRIPPGVTAVVGPNGAGKTTLFGILTGRIRPTHGEVRFNGQPVDAVRESLGYLFENPPFYPYLTADQQLRYYNALREHPATNTEVQRALQHWGVFHSKPIKAFSLGMRKRLGLANAFLGRPRVVILDEPFNGLDLEGQQLLEEAIDAYRSTNTTLIFSSHQLERITLIADRIIILNRGAIAYNGTTLELSQRAQHMVMYLPRPARSIVLQSPLVLQHGEQGGWLTATIHKDKAPLFLHELAQHGIAPHSSRLLIPEFEQIFGEA